MQRVYENSHIALAGIQPSLTLAYLNDPLWHSEALTLQHDY